MTLNSLRALTWGTVAGAVLSALLLAAGESGLPDWSRLRRGDAASASALPGDPTGATLGRKSTPVPAAGSRGPRGERAGR
ncbi:hypothetical protein [Piscinibacter sp.]|jgi:hypothetical protein|uniref:hypothetical protein n=1 Tax=Piscinibacter sp. TaxID=1903157 RepID=UPI002F4209D3